MATPTLFLCTSFAKFRPTAYHMWTASYRRMSSTCPWPSELKARLLVDEPYRSGSTEDVPSNDTDAEQDFVKYMYYLMNHAGINSKQMLNYIHDYDPNNHSSTRTDPTPINEAQIQAFLGTFQSEEGVKNFSIRYMNARGDIDERLLYAFINILRSDEQVCTAVQEYIEEKGEAFTTMENALTDENGDIDILMFQTVSDILRGLELEMYAQKLIMERLYAS